MRRIISNIPRAVAPIEKSTRYVEKQEGRKTRVVPLSLARVRALEKQDDVAALSAKIDATFKEMDAAFNAVADLIDGK